MYLPKIAITYYEMRMNWNKRVNFDEFQVGISPAYNFFQQRMIKLFQDLSLVVVYIDSILILGDGTYKEHMELVSEVISRLRRKGMQLNIKKYSFTQESAKNLGFIVTDNWIWHDEVELT